MQADLLAARHDSRAEATSSPAFIYEARCVQFAALRERYRRYSDLNANLNVALVLAALLCLALGLWRGGWPLYLLAAVFALVFVGAYVYLGRLNQIERRYQTLWEINDEGLRRLRRDWAKLPLRQPPPSTPAGEDTGGTLPAPATHYPQAADLDLLGHASLQHLLHTPNTPVGKSTLQGWLLEPAAPASIKERQEAVAELALLVGLRDTLAVTGRLIETTQASYERFLEWAESPPWLAGRMWLVWLSRVLAALTLGLIAAQISGLVSYPVWLFVLPVNIGLCQTIGRVPSRLIGEVSERQETYRAYANLFQIITGQPFSAPLLQRLQATLSADGLRADEQMRRLVRRMPLVDIRGMMFFIIIQWLTLWDIHVLWLLERWQRVAGSSTRAWLEALGEMEALAALATLTFDHPTWTFPTITPDEPVVRGANLGHPLLAPAACVGSDVSVGPPGTFLLVTGSNMSGKSTLLRALGVNITLAQAGGPVCADALSLPPITLATTIRVQDSLEQGVSYFMAELQRLKEVVTIATQTRAASPTPAGKMPALQSPTPAARDGGGTKPDGTLPSFVPPSSRRQEQGWERLPFFLLDEILHGTNTAERQIAVRQIVRHLLSLGATGVVSTHDLTLAQMPEIATSAQLVHFTETFTRGPDGLKMTFDYKLRPGIATSTNALKLLEMAGLPLDEALHP
jgi:ABC-type multidrug transport system fused ATPase/permease subunit